MKVLVVDDEKIKRITLRDDLREANYETIAVESPTIALQLLQNEYFDVLVTDLRMPKMHGIEFLKRVKKEYPQMTVIIMTAYASVETAVEAMKFGAYNYIKKPFSSHELIVMLDKLKGLRGGEGFETRAYPVHMEQRYPYHDIIGKSQSMKEIFNLLETISDSSSNVLIYGERGTGKALLAKSIHLNSLRRHQPFVAVNCAGISKEGLESEIFGQEKPPLLNSPPTLAEEGEGADTPDRKSGFKLAHKGTLFLKEVNHTPAEFQAKLLRILEELAFERVRGSRTIHGDVRVIASTTENLRNKVQSGAFRDDLFYRLNVVPIFLPPLRERAEDIPLLINHFLELFSPNRPIHSAPQAVELLMGYPWPGNVRELENAIERLVTVGGGRDITVEDIPLEFKLPTSIGLHDTLGETSFQEIIQSTERELIAWAMQKTKGNKTQAAKLLKMKPSTFRDALSKYINEIEWER